jgi:hypothetical protein
MRDAEVGEHRAPVGVDQHVIRLDVPVHDPDRVSSAQRRQNLQPDLRCLLRRQRAAPLDDVPQ